MSNWASHVSRLGPSFMKIWTCGSSPQCRSWNVWTRIKNVNSASRLSNFWNFFSAIQMISCCDWWPWTKPGYITMSRRQSNNQWSGGKSFHPAPKNSECKNPLEKFSPRFFGIKTASSSLTSKGPNYQCRVLLISAGAIEGHFEGKTPWKGHQGGLVLARQCPSSRSTCNSEETGLPGLPVSWSPILFSGLAPSDYHLFPGLKNNWKFASFCPTRRLLLPWRPGWTDNLLNFFWVACKS